MTNATIYSSVAAAVFLSLSADRNRTTTPGCHQAPQGSLFSWKGVMCNVGRLSSRYQREKNKGTSHVTTGQCPVSARESNVLQTLESQCWAANPVASVFLIATGSRRAGWVVTTATSGTFRTLPLIGTLKRCWERVGRTVNVTSQLSDSRPAPVSLWGGLSIFLR